MILKMDLGRRSIKYIHRFGNNKICYFYRRPQWALVFFVPQAYTQTFLSREQHKKSLLKIGFLITTLTVSVDYVRRFH